MMIKLLNKFLLPLLLILLATFFLLHLVNLNFIQDDAFIYLRYVKNYWSGNGLVFNKGEFVEGYTSFLWLLLLVFGRLFTVKTILLAGILSSLLGFATVLLMAFVVSLFIKLPESKHPIIYKLLLLLPSFLLVFSAGFIYWSVSGMETSLFVFLFLLSYYLKLKNKKSYLGVLILLAIARPEGILIFALFILSDLLYARLSKNKIKSSEILNNILIFILPVALHFVFRFIYYGSFFSNTFYAKTGFDYFYLKRGLNYFLNFWGNPFAIILFLFPTIYVAIKYYRNYRGLLNTNIVLVYSFYIILIGGDVLPSIRFFLPLLPLVLINLTIFLNDFFPFIIEHFNTKYGNVLILLTLSAITIYSVNYFNKNEQTLLRWRAYEKGLVYKMKLYAEWINKVQNSNKTKYTVALSTIGAFSYYSNSRVLDIIGLTDSYIAHNPEEVKGIAGRISVKWKERNYNVKYVLDSKPNFIIFPAGAKPASYPEAALFSSLRFHRNYYLTLFYSKKFYELLPIFKKRALPFKFAKIRDNNNCSPEFVEDYLKANNFFLSYLKTKKAVMLDSVKNYCNNLIVHCPNLKYLAFNVMGYSSYHAGKINEALKYFKKACKLNNVNPVALIYMVNIYRRLKLKKELNLTVIKLKKIAPYVYPNLILK